MARIHMMPFSPVPSTVDQWLELCSGGMLAGLSAALANGVTVKTVTLVEKSRMVRYMAVARLNALHQLHPALLSRQAIDHPFKVDQDVTKITASDFRMLPAVTVVFATPPCQPFSKAGPTPGWDSEESKPFISCVNLIKEMSKMQPRTPTYIVENVPNSARFIEIADALGPALIIEAHRLGSSAYRKTTLWTNAAPRETLMDHYNNHQ
jgi:site-specific DNA-cytosine methylase